MKRKVYISGPMTGIANLNREAFAWGEAQVIASGLTPVNPHTLCDPLWSWHQCMRADVSALVECDAIVMLSGWQKSSGAQLELHVAHRVGIEVLPDFDALREYARRAA